MKINQPYKNKTVAIAGTFDRLHKGHHYFITETFKLGKKVIIGLTSDQYVRQKFEIRNSKLEIKSDKDTSGVARRDSPDGGGISKKIKIQNFQLRKEELEIYLKTEGLLGRAEIVKISDVYGPAIKRAGRRENEIEALVVTEETYEGGLAVNRRRSELGLKPLELIKVSLILAEDKKRIASSRIRIGEIDRWGKLFVSRITYHVSRINEELRQELKKPLGKLIKGDPRNLNYAAEELKKIVAETQPVMIITVGDEVTKVCNETGIAINLAIFDYKVGRKVKYHSLEELGFPSFVIPRSETTRDLSRMRVYTVSARTSREIPRPDLIGARNDIVIEVKNPAGHVTKELVEAVNNAYQKLIETGRQQMVEVIGEEDLAGVPAVLLAPLGAIVLYGQPQEGVVMVEVTEDKKNELLSLINKNL